MVSIFAFNQRADGDEDEISLGSPDDSERADLGRHVDRCAKRYRMISVRQRMMNGDLQQVKYLLYGFGAYLLLTSSPAAKIVTLLFGG